MKWLYTVVLGCALACAVCPLSVGTADAQSAESGEVAKPPEESPSKIKAIAGYALSIAGGFVVLALVVHTLSRTLKYEQARNAIVHMLRTNPNHAEYQCQTMPHSFYDAIGAALKAGAMTGGTQDLSMIQNATVPSYDAIGSVVAQHWKGLVGKAKLAAIAALGGIALRPGGLTITIAVIAVAGVAWLTYYKHEIDRSIFRAKVEVLPEVDRAFADGRYVIPPRPV